MEKLLNELELNAIEDAWLMPAVTPVDRIERAFHLDNVKFWLENRVSFETDNWMEMR